HAAGGVGLRARGVLVAPAPVGDGPPGPAVSARGHALSVIAAPVSEKVAYRLGVGGADDGTGGSMKREAVEAERRRLPGRPVALQHGVVAPGARICVLFEGRDAAGKGGSIRPLAERVSPRVFRVVALPAPTDRERSQLYMQRYIPHLPAAGEIVIFDRSWYNR